MALEAIIAKKREECVQIRSLARAILPKLEPSQRSFSQALRPDPGKKQGDAFILECKKASPSKGLIREDFDLEQILESYAPFASAVSILTDSEFFQGDFSFLKAANQKIRQPILCKDFILEPAQVQWARFHGADAILLMLSVLTDEQYRICAAEAQKWNLDILTEIHDEHECRRALELGAPIVGINNRNLKDLSIDLSTTSRLASLVPKDRILISESGIYTHQDVLKLRCMVDGFLVGSSLMERTDLSLAVRELIFGRVKVCGLTSMQDAELAYQHGASWGGMILHAASIREIDLKTAKTMCDKIPLRWVGVFADAPVEKILRAVEYCALDVVQLHGQESLHQIESLRQVLPSHVKIWKALSLTIEESIPCLKAEAPIDRFLLDRMVHGRRGGTGLALNWDSLSREPSRNHAILAGGLNTSNIAEADQLGMWALDVASGLENTPDGEKAPEKNRKKMKIFFDRLRGGEK